MNRAPRPRGKTRFVNSRPERINYNNLLKEMQEEQENGSFTLLEKTIMKQQEEAEALDTFKEISDEISEEERLKRHRASLMSNIDNKYAYSSKDEIIHDKDCELVSKIPDDEFEMKTNWQEPCKICKKCYRYCLLRTGIIDDYKNIESYYTFFKGGADNELLHYLIIQNKAKFRFVDSLKNSIQIKVKEDSWLLHRDKNKKYTLYHNNYIPLENGERHFTDGYHKQRCKDNGTSARFAISTMCTYLYNEHIEKEHIKNDKMLYGRDCPKWIKRLIKELKHEQKKSAS